MHESKHGQHEKNGLHRQGNRKTRRHSIEESSDFDPTTESTTSYLWASCLGIHSSGVWTKLPGESSLVESFACTGSKDITMVGVAKLLIFLYLFSIFYIFHVEFDILNDSYRR